MGALRKITSIAAAVAIVVTSVGFSAFLSNAETASVVINEVCLGNKGENGNLTDIEAVYEKDGATKTELCDWIELYNPTNSSVDVSGYKLKKIDLDKTDKTESINGTAVVPAKGYLVLYCNKNLDASMTDSKPYIEMNLSSDGLDLDFQNSASQSVDTLTVPALVDDTTFARIPDGDNSCKTVFPTPGESNNNAKAYIQAPKFSIDSGAFNDSFSLEITAEEGAEIFYTTDGSIPTAESTKYTEAITVVDRSSEDNVLSAISKDILTDDDHRGNGRNAPTVKVDKATVIRAIAIKDGDFSEVVTKSYFVGKTNETYAGVPIISIVTDADNLFDDEIGIYLQKNCKNKGKEWERPIHIDYIKDNEAVFSQECGIRIQGGYSRGEYQKSLRLYARSDYGEKSFKYDFFDGKAKDREGNTITSFKKITLRNGGNDANYVKYKDSLLQTCVLDRNFSTQASVPCIAFINGEYWGIYTMQEDYNDDYAENHFGVDKDNVVMIKPDTENNNEPKIEEGEDSDVELWNDFVSYIKDPSTDFTNKADYEKVSHMLDLDSFADYVAAETYISNEDWSGKNWEVWRTRTVDTENGGKYSDGKWRFMFYDVEMGAFLWGNPGESSENDKLYQIYNGGRKGDEPIQIMVYKLMQNPIFAQKVFNNIDNLAKTSYEPSRVNEIMNQLHNLYYPNLNKYFQRFPTGATIGGADQCEEYINTFFHGGYGKFQDYVARDVYAEYMIKYNQAVIKCESFDIGDCVSGYAEMSSRLTTLKTLLANTQSTQKNKLNAYEKFLTEYNNLVLNKSGEVKELLFDTISIKKNNSSDYRWSEFQTAYNELFDIFNNSSADDSQRTVAINKLKTAINNLSVEDPSMPSNPSGSLNPSDSSNNPSDSSNPSGSDQSEPSNSGSSQPTSVQPATNAPTTASPKITSPTATTVTKPAKVKAVKLKAKKMKLNVSWKKVSGATGYEVKAATNSKFTKGKKTVTVKKNKVTIKNLKPKKKYFVKVRAYKLANGRKHYGKWSKVVNKKTK